jgi:hypothetical protein
VDALGGPDDWVEHRYQRFRTMGAFGT